MALRSPSPISPRAWQNSLPIFERNYVHGNGRQFWFIIEDEKHIPIGTITYFNIDYRIGQVEIGLGLGEKTRWGKGYGPEAIRTLVHYLFYHSWYSTRITRRRQPLIDRHAAPSPKPTLSRSAKSMTPAAQANPGYF